MSSKTECKRTDSFLFLQKKLTMFGIILLISLLIIAISFAAIGIKMFVKKDGKFERRCENEGSVNCLCGGRGGEACRHCPNGAKH